MCEHNTNRVVEMWCSRNLFLGIDLCKDTRCGVLLAWRSVCSAYRQFIFKEDKRKTLAAFKTACAFFLLAVRAAATLTKYIVLLIVCIRSGCTKGDFTD